MSISLQQQALHKESVILRYLIKELKVQSTDRVPAYICAGLVQKTAKPVANCVLHE